MVVGAWESGELSRSSVPRDSSDQQLCEGDVTTPSFTTKERKSHGGVKRLAGVARWELLGRP